MMMIAERIARVLTERFVEDNDLAETSGERSTDRLVEQHWRAHMPLARAVLRAIREPDPAVENALAETGAWQDAIDDVLAQADERVLARC